MPHPQDDVERAKDAHVDTESRLIPNDCNRERQGSAALAKQVIEPHPFVVALWHVIGAADHAVPYGDQPGPLSRQQLARRDPANVGLVYKRVPSELRRSTRIDVCTGALATEVDVCGDALEVARDLVPQIAFEQVEADVDRNVHAEALHRHEVPWSDPVPVRGNVPTTPQAFESCS